MAEFDSKILDRPNVAIIDACQEIDKNEDTDQDGDGKADISHGDLVSLNLPDVNVTCYDVTGEFLPSQNELQTIINENYLSLAQNNRPKYNGVNISLGNDIYS